MCVCVCVCVYVCVYKWAMHVNSFTLRTFLRCHLTLTLYSARKWPLRRNCCCLLCLVDLWENQWQYWNYLSERVHGYRFCIDTKMISQLDPNAAISMIKDMKIAKYGISNRHIRKYTTVLGNFPINNFQLYKVMRRPTCVWKVQNDPFSKSMHRSIFHRLIDSSVNLVWTQLVDVCNANTL